MIVLGANIAMNLNWGPRAVNRMRSRWRRGGTGWSVILTVAGITCSGSWSVFMPVNAIFKMLKSIEKWMKIIFSLTYCVALSEPVAIKSLVF
jgi:hypothetical protein